MDFKLPALPTALAEIIKIQRSQAPDIGRLIEIIENDPAIALYVLRQVNSAYYGLRKQVSQINRAVTLLGSKRVCNLVLAATLKHTFSKVKGPAARAVYQHILQISIATAVFARDLAEHLRLSSADMAFTAGLFHQIGRLVLLYNVSDQYLPLWYQRLPEQEHTTLVSPSLEAEQTYFQVDSLHIGANALNQWGLPEELVAIIHRIRTVETVTEPPVRILPLLVAIGRSMAENIFDPPGFGSYADHEVNGRYALLDALVRFRNLSLDALNEFLDAKNESIQHYVESMVQVA